MSQDNQIISIENIQSMIFTFRGVQVILDRDLAQIYQVGTKVLNQAVKRNIERFPENFRFQLTGEEYENLRFQIGTLEHSKKILRSQSATLKNGRGKHRKYLPYAFTEQGVSMLSAVLHSETAIQVSISIMNAFVNMRKFLLENAMVFKKIEYIDKKLLKHDENFEKIFKALENKSIKPKQGIFYDGQVFDAYVFIAGLVKSAKKSILLIDNYVDETILQLFTKRKKNVSVTIYTKHLTKILKQDLEKHNSQHPEITIKKFTKAHDRFLIIDGKIVYHFGASLKDLGKKWFAFSKMDLKAMEIIANLKAVNREE